MMDYVLELEDNFRALEKDETILNDIQEHSIVRRSEALDIMRDGILYNDGRITYPHIL